MRLSLCAFFVRFRAKLPVQTIHNLVVLYQFESSSDGQLDEDAASEAAGNAVVPERRVTLLDETFESLFISSSLKLRTSVTRKLNKILPNF